jgi:hypothetical protein
MTRLPHGRRGLRLSPRSAAPGRSGLETKAGRAPAPPIDVRTRGAAMSVRRGEHAPKYLHRQLIRVSASGSIGYRYFGGEC